MMTFIRILLNVSTNSLVDEEGWTIGFYPEIVLRGMSSLGAGKKSELKTKAGVSI